MDELIAFGSEVKSLGNGKIGGYLILFSDQNTPDLTGDFFDASTDFATDFPTKAAVYYAHGQDPKLRKTRLGPKVETKSADVVKLNIKAGEIGVDDVGIWIEHQLDLADEYQAAVSALVEKKALGWSSGSASHLVEREPAGKAWHITHWPIIEASLTPCPAEPRARALPLKSIRFPDLGAFKDMTEMPVTTYAPQDTGETRFYPTQTVLGVAQGALDDCITDVLTTLRTFGVLSTEQYTTLRTAGDALVDSLVAALGASGESPAPYGLCDALCDDDDDDMYKSLRTMPTGWREPAKSSSTDDVMQAMRRMASLADDEGETKAGRKMSAATHKQMGEHLKQIKGGYDGLALLHKGMGTQTPPADTAGKSIDEAARTEMRRAMMSTQMLLNTPTR